jgi:hypothetical protein
MQSPGARASFGDVVRRVLAVEKKQKLKEAAAALEMTERAFHTRMRGGGRFDPNEIAVLIGVIEDERLPRWFFSGTDLILVKRPMQAANGKALTMHERTAACLMEAVVAISSVADVMDLSMQGERRPTVLVEHLDRAQGGLWSIRLHLTSSFAGLNPASPNGMFESFPSLVRRALRMDRGVSFKALAGELNLKYNAFNGRLAGRVGFTPSDLRLLFLKFADPCVANFILSKSAYLAVLRPRAVDGEDVGDPAQLALHSMRELLKLLGQLLAAGEMNLPMSKAVDRHLTEATQLLALLRWRVTHLGRPEPFLSVPGSPPFLPPHTDAAAPEGNLAPRDYGRREL